MENSIELNLKELMALIVRRLWLIVLSAIVVGAMAYVYTAKFVTPLYEAGIKLYVSNSVYGDKESITSNDQTASQKLVEDYIQVIKSDSFLEKVSLEVNGKVSSDKLKNTVSTKKTSNSQVLTVYISSDNAELAAEIANAIADLVPVAVPETVAGSSAKVIDYAKVPTSPYHPSYTKNVTLGGCIGAMLIIFALVIQLLMDLHVKGEEDLKKLSDAPVLGHIPHYDAVSKSYGYEYESDTTEDNSNSEVVDV